MSRADLVRDSFNPLFKVTIIIDTENFLIFFKWEFLDDDSFYFQILYNV